jgi:DNA-binding MarR family transcriptional regulator
MKKSVEVMGRMEKVNLLRRIQGQRIHRELGLYQGQIPVLDFIRKNPDCNQVDIAEKLHVTPATIAISTKRMEKAGLLTKKIDEDNLRCKLLNITEVGERKCDDAYAAYSSCTDGLFKDFSDEELSQLESFLDRVLVNLAHQLDEDPEKMDFATLSALLKAGEKCLED